MRDGERERVERNTKQKHKEKLVVWAVSRSSFPGSCFVYCSRRSFDFMCWSLCSLSSPLSLHVSNALFAVSEVNNLVFVVYLFAFFFVFVSSFASCSALVHISSSSNYSFLCFLIFFFLFSIFHRPICQMQLKWFYEMLDSVFLVIFHVKWQSMRHHFQHIQLEDSCKLSVSVNKQILNKNKKYVFLRSFCFCLRVYFMRLVCFSSCFYQKSLFCRFVLTLNSVTVCVHWIMRWAHTNHQRIVFQFFFLSFFHPRWCCIVESCAKDFVVVNFCFCSFIFFQVLLL